MTSKIINRLSLIDSLIVNKNTGTPQELSRKLKISERCARGYIKTLKSLGAPIAFNRKFKSYFYKEDGFFSFRYTKVAPANNEDSRPSSI